MMGISKHDRGTLVYVIDDDAAIREALGSLIRSVGLSVETFAVDTERFWIHPTSHFPAQEWLHVRADDRSVA
jgi:FixJ family two-component response regulator